MSTERDQNAVEVEQNEPSLTGAPSQVQPSDCGCGCGGSKDSCTKNTSSPPRPSRFNSCMRLEPLASISGPKPAEIRSFNMSAGSDTSNPTFDLNAMLKYLLDKNPWDAQSLLWTLNLDSTPIYVIQPAGACRRGRIRSPASVSP